jgi:hypothetical protein
MACCLLYLLVSLSVLLLLLLLRVLVLLRCTGLDGCAMKIARIHIHAMVLLLSARRVHFRVGLFGVHDK